MFRVLLLTTVLATVSLAQLTSSCTSCNTNSNYDKRTRRQIPGYLPNYQGDAFTSDARRQETLRLNQQFFDQLGPSGQLSDAPEPPKQHLTFKNRPIPIIFADPETERLVDSEDGPLFVEIVGDDTNATTRTTPTLEFVQFTVQPDGKTDGKTEQNYESEATRAIIEALTRDDPRFIQKDFHVEFVDESVEQ